MSHRFKPRSTRIRNTVTLVAALGLTLGLAVPAAQATPAPTSSTPTTVTTAIQPLATTVPNVCLYRTSSNSDLQLKAVTSAGGLGTVVGKGTCGRFVTAYVNSWEKAFVQICGDMANDGRSWVCASRGAEFHFDQLTWRGVTGSIKMSIV